MFHAFVAMSNTDIFCTQISLITSYEVFSVLY